MIIDPSAFSSTACATLANFVCVSASGVTCQCLQANGLTLAGNHNLQNASMVLALGTNFSTELAAPDRACFAAEGLGIVTTDSGNSTLALETSGLLCNSPTLGLRLYTGTFGVSQSGSGSFANSGRYVGASGAGEMSLNFNVTNGFSNAPTTLHMAGVLTQTP